MNGMVTLAARGRVVDVLGAPIANATVILRCGGDVVGERRTGADGAFRFEPVKRRRDAWPEVEAIAAGMARSVHGLSYVGDTPICITLLHGCTLDGRVIDDGGGGLGGVEVVVVQRREDTHRQSTRTEDDGTFHFEAVAIGRTTVMAFRDGWQLAVCETHAGGGKTLEIRLAKAHGRMIRFRIHGASPEQLALAKCYFFDTDLALPESCLHGRPDANGIWEKRGLPNEHTYSSLQVAIPGMSCDPRFEFCHPHPKSGCYEFHFTMRAEVSRALRGRVTGADGTPLSGIAVEAGCNFTGDARFVTDADGRFSFDTCARDGEDVWFELSDPALVLDATGFAEFRSPKNRHAHIVRLPCEDDVELTAVPAARLRVVCTNADGSPAVSAFISVEIAWRKESEVTSQLATGSTDERGEVAFAGLHPQPGATIAVQVEGDGWRASSSSVRLEAGGEVTVHVQGPPVGAVAGIVRDAVGAPLPGEAIGVYGDAGWHAEWPLQTATSDHVGRFRIASLAAGEYRFGPARPHRSTQWRSEPFVVTAGAELQRDVVSGAAT